MDRNTRVILAFLAAGAVGAAVMISSWRYTGPAPAKVKSPPVAAEAVDPEPELITESLPIRRRDTLDDLLVRAGVDRAAKVEMIAAVEKAFDVKKFRAGSELTLFRSQSGTLESLEYVIDPDHKLQLSNADGIFSAAVVDIPGIIHPVAVCGTIHGSLFESMERAGERPELTLRMAEIFAWDLDFYTDPREGDEFCILVEKKVYTNGQPATYRRILAAKYNNAGTLYEGFLFPDKDGKEQYYSRDGRSLQAAFLRSPMKFEARVSSHFSYRRLHPILKIRRPHLGTDYAAPTGTPVQAIAAGRVVFSGRSGGSGNLIKIRHANGFETQYMHLSRRFVRTGQRVAQGQRIGLVGATGLATGPHLDFRMRKKGRFVNFERLKPPRLTKITAEQQEEFAAARDRFTTMMDLDSRAGTTVIASGALPTSSESVP
jgi:murein DD-endopeptidase MepM/ murein hydrolase activator NlpD